MNRTENSQLIKAKARELGVDLTGIAPAEELNLNPPDPRWPQTPQRIWDECSSVIIIARRVPWGIFRTRDLSTRLYVPHLVMGRLDSISLEISYFIEDYGFRALPIAQNYTDPALKRGTYGSISLRHAAVEAGLGTLGLNLNLITPQFGPRVYLQAILTDFPLEPDEKLKNPVCLGPKCGRCLLSCPSDAVDHWNIDKRRCSTQAQRYGVAALFRHLHHIIDAETREEAKSLIRSMRWRRRGGEPRCACGRRRRVLE